MSRQPVVAVDFDGTICEFRYPYTGPLKEGVCEALQRIRDLGYQILVYSCRAAAPDLSLGITPELKIKALRGMIDYLDWNKVPYDEIDIGDKGKPFADYYIDDKGIRFDDNWREVTDFVEADSARKSKGEAFYNGKPKLEQLIAVTSRPVE